MHTDLADHFEAARSHLRSVAFHLLGSVDDADDAVQGTWVKASRADWRAIQNLTGWLTTITVHESIDQLRARRRRNEVPLNHDGDPPAAAHISWAPAAEEEVLRTDTVSRALLVVLDRLSPAQRVAFVLHDVFAMPFDEIAVLLDRSPVATKKLASRARHRLRADPDTEPTPNRGHLRVVEAFLAAVQGGDISAMLELLAPDVVRRVDRILVPDSVPAERRGRDDVAEESRAFIGRARSGAVVLVDGMPGIAIAPRGRLRAVLRIEVREDALVHEIDIIGDPDRLDHLVLTLSA
ncbi:MAG: sigma-70 family RNA polymerase sigma factor [Acidimicrobiia bacterium]|nr:sigma-70 family RNA polymerase sigma factor [Acidimicrobiia bacterium]